MKETFKFLKDLKHNNNREWFNANKERYLAAKERTDDFTAALIDAVAQFDPRASRLDVRDCTYRIYRDTRFFPDKTPYKNHIGIFINPPGGKKSLTCGYYFHLEPGNSAVYAGTIGLPGKIVSAIRQSIRDEIDEYRGIVEDPAFRSLFPNLGANFVKTAPKGFDKDWDYIDYVRPRDFCASSATIDSIYTGKNPIKHLIPYIEHAFRFNAFINYTIEQF